MDYKISLSAARVNAGLNLAEASKTLGISTKTLSRWEKGESSPRVEQLRKLCALYAVPIDCLRFG